MSLFYYRAWAGVESRGPGSVSINLREDTGLYYTRWGYCALLGITMAAGIILNLVYLAGYWAFPRAMLEVPHVAIVSLALRDLLVCVLVVPAALDWLVAGLTSWPGGEMWCKTAVFVDYYLTTLHPLLILMLCVVLYTRKLPPKMTPPSPAPIVNTRFVELSTQYERHLDNIFHYSRMSQRSGYTHRTGQSGRPHQSSRAPSVAASVMSSSRHDGSFRKGFAKREGSVNGSYAGSVTGRQQLHPNSRDRRISQSSQMSHTNSYR